MFTICVAYANGWKLLPSVARCAALTLLHCTPPLALLQRDAVLNDTDGNRCPDHLIIEIQRDHKWAPLRREALRCHPKYPDVLKDLEVWALCRSAKFAESTPSLLR